jgi:hypothetical protein
MAILGQISGQLAKYDQKDKFHSNDKFADMNEVKSLQLLTMAQPCKSFYSKNDVIGTSIGRSHIVNF